MTAVLSYAAITHTDTHQAFQATLSSPILPSLAFMNFNLSRERQKAIKIFLFCEEAAQQVHLYTQYNIHIQVEHSGVKGQLKIHSATYTSR